jgi:hypothetical protein
MAVHLQIMERHQVNQTCSVHLQVVWMLDTVIKINMVRCPVMEKGVTFEEKVIVIDFF